MKYLGISLAAGIFLLMQSAVFAQNENIEADKTEYISSLHEKIRNDGIGTPPGREWFDVKMGPVTKNLRHWKTGARYLNRKTNYYWVFFVDNKSGIAIGELSECGSFKIMRVGISDGAVFYKIKPSSTVNQTFSCLQEHPGFINMTTVEPNEKVSRFVQEWADHIDNSVYKNDSGSITVSIELTDTAQTAEKMKVLSGIADSVRLLGIYDRSAYFLPK